MFIRFDTIHESDRHTHAHRHTDRHFMTAKAALALFCIASRCKNDVDAYCHKRPEIYLQQCTTPVKIH